ncbi:hypothetical protein ACIBO4_04635 [Streptomyces sp. NPDC050149]|uniref:hypothetical protein n=1 Tax=Streptomyces sp. NPDC050149 TaxID=3365603 RepID=UPI00378D08E2
MADRVLIDDGSFAGAVRELLPGGVGAALELVGTPTLPDTLAATRVHGARWLTAYGGDSADLPAPVLQRFLDGIADGDVVLGPVNTYSLDGIRQAHADKWSWDALSGSSLF